MILRTDNRAILDAFHKTAKSDYQASLCPSAGNNSPPTGRIFMKFGIWVCFEKLSRKFKFHYNMTTITGNLRYDQYTCMAICRSTPLIKKNVSDKGRRKN
jgi:hypothetical protein